MNVASFASKRIFGMSQELLYSVDHQLGQDKDVNGMGRSDVHIYCDVYFTGEHI